MSVVLEDFSSSDGRAPAERHGGMSLAEAEALRTDAYGQGYQAGWDDAIKSGSEEEAAIDAELAKHFQEMSFTFHEARAHLVNSFEPLLEHILKVFLPDLVQETMGDRILQTLEPLIADTSNAAVLVRVAPGIKASLEAKLANASLSAFSIVEEETLSGGQAFLRLGEVERKIDLNEAFDQIIESLKAVSELNERALEDE